MNEFPRTNVESLSVSRMIVGTNWFLGFSHTSAAKDRFIKEHMTPKRIADVLEVFLRAGVDTTMGLIENEKYREAIQDAQDRTGRKLIVISTPHLNVSREPGAEAENERTFDDEARRGTSICMPHQASTDVLLDRVAGTIHKMDRCCAMIRDRGMIPGLSTHSPWTPGVADASGLDVATYIQIYNAAGFLMHLEVDWVHRIIHKAAKPVMTIKPMAAGRLLPLVGLAFVWATIRDRDMVTIGTMTPDEAREVIDISLSILEGRTPSVELQRTRSKAGIDAE